MSMELDNILEYLDRHLEHSGNRQDTSRRLLVQDDWEAEAAVGGNLSQTDRRAERREMAAAAVDDNLFRMGRRAGEMAAVAAVADSLSRADRLTGVGAGGSLSRLDRMAPETVVKEVGDSLSRLDNKMPDRVPVPLCTVYLLGRAESLDNGTDSDRSYLPGTRVVLLIHRVRAGYDNSTLQGTGEGEMPGTRYQQDRKWDMVPDTRFQQGTGQDLVGGTLSRLYSTFLGSVQSVALLIALLALLFLTVTC